MNLRWELITYLVVLTVLNTGCEKEEFKSDLLVYGHAGTSLFPERWIYPANTKESVLYALDVLDADGVELDVQMTKDSVLVLYHDEYLDKNTTLSGCIPEYNLIELNDLNVYQTRFELMTLEQALSVIFERNRNVILDLKPYNYCDSANVDFGIFNRALNRVLLPYSHLEKTKIVANALNISLLNSLTDTSIVKSFETQNENYAIQYFQNGYADEICFDASKFSDEIRSQFETNQIPFSLFGVKTQGEIKRGIEFSPKRIITDNISYTRKFVY
jgi:glycerophosphoryl diester phosphodiesterase